MLCMPSSSASVTNPVPSSHLPAAPPPQILLFRVFCPEKKLLEEPGHVLSPGSTAIGREPSGDRTIKLPPDDKGLSRDHASLTVDLEHQTIVLRDSSSKNSTWVNGLRLNRGEDRKLFHGDVLRLGDTVFVLSMTPSFTDPMEPDTQSSPAKESAQQHTENSQVLGRSPLIERLRRQIRRLAQAGQSVLLLGERGTGKERAAAEFHSHSGRRGPMVAIDCGALTKEIAASELFGHEKGAFTGAIGEKKGALVSSDHGTLFLDEIGNLSLENQEKLLRALESRSIQAVGSLGKPGQRVDILLVSATSKDLAAETKSGRFKPDLFDRIAATTLTMPPLRNRREDILFLLQRAKGAGHSAASTLPPLNTSQVELLLLYAWPGNVRELINIRGDLCAQGFHEDLQKQLMKATYFQFSGNGPATTVAIPSQEESTPTTGGASAKAKPTKKSRLTEEQLRELLIKHDGKLLPIANETGWDSHTLRDWVAKYNLHHLRKKDT